MSEPILAWHFVSDTLRDGSPVPPDGEWLEYEGPVEMCFSGLHASRNPLDALLYAPGSLLCRVECDEVIDEVDDKLVCRRRRIIQRLDMTDTLRAYARQCALSVANLWDMPAVVRQYLETGDEGIRDATLAAVRAAARDAARDAARSAARSAVRDAAWAAARDAARAAARDAAWDAVRGAAWDAAWGAAAWDGQRNNFASIVEEAFKKARDE